MKIVKSISILCGIVLGFVACDDGASSAGVSTGALSCSTDFDGESSSSSDAFVEYSSENEDLLSSSSLFFKVSSSSAGEKIFSSGSKNDFSSSSVVIGSSESSGAVIEWVYRDRETRILKFNNDSSSVQAAGRFWLIKEVPVSKDEYRSLKNIGVEIYDCNGLFQNGRDYDICFAKTEKSIKKIVIDSLVAGLFNTFDVDDTSEVIVDLSRADWIVDGEKIEAIVDCWYDVSLDACYDFVKSCGGVNLRKDNPNVITEVLLGELRCLASNKNVMNLDVRHVADVL